MRKGQLVDGNKCTEKSRYSGRRKDSRDDEQKGAASNQIFADLLCKKSASAANRGMFARTVYKPGSVFA